MTRKLLKMRPVKVDQQDSLPPIAGVFLVTDSDGVHHPSPTKNIRERATRVCSRQYKSHLADTIALRRSRVQRDFRPNSPGTLANLRAHNALFKAVRAAALEELPSYDIRYIPVEDKMMRDDLAAHLKERFAPKPERMEPTERERARLIGNANN